MPEAKFRRKDEKLVPLTLAHSKTCCLSSVYSGVARGDIVVVVKFDACLYQQNYAGANVELNAWKVQTFWWGFFRGAPVILQFADEPACVKLNDRCWRLSELWKGRIAIAILCAVCKTYSRPAQSAHCRASQGESRGLFDRLSR